MNLKKKKVQNATKDIRIDLNSVCMERDLFCICGYKKENNFKWEEQLNLIYNSISILYY